MTESLSHENDERIQRAAAGDQAAFAELLERFQPRLTKMVQLRMGAQLADRVEVSDILQDVSLEVFRRLPAYAARPPMRFSLWLRQLAEQKLIDCYRYHFRTQKRNPDAEISIYRSAMLDASSAVIANQLAGRLTSPTKAVERAELQMAIQDALQELSETDREVLLLRHFEGLSNDEVAELLQLKKSPASKRYVSALSRMGELLRDIPGAGDLTL